MISISDKFLETVRASPAFVAKHDKQGWLGLFARNAVVEDPVGAAPNRSGVLGGKSQDEIGRFYDTFIAPNEIRFEVKEDIVAGTHVLRDVIIHTRLSSGFQIEVPAHLLYEMSEEEGQPRIARLAAHWELPRLSIQAMSGGLRGLLTMGQLGARMLRIQGLSGVLGYARATRGIFGRGRHAVAAVASAIQNCDAPALASLFVDDEPRIELPYGDPCSAIEVVERIGNGAHVSVQNPNAAGFFTTALIDIRSPQHQSHSIALIAFDSASKKITSARFYTSLATDSETLRVDHAASRQT